VQAVVVGGFGRVGIESTGESAGALVLLVVALGAILALFGFALVQAATVRALVEIDQGHAISPIHAYRLALQKLDSLVRGLAIAAVAWVALFATAFLIPVALWLAVRWILLASTSQLKRRLGQPLADPLEPGADELRPVLVEAVQHLVPRPEAVVEQCALADSLPAAVGA
jgi:hypothetical protein